LNLKNVLHSHKVGNESGSWPLKDIFHFACLFNFSIVNNGTFASKGQRFSKIMCHHQKGSIGG